MPESEKPLPVGKYENFSGTLSRKRGKRDKPYKKQNPLEERGKQKSEYNVQKSFWRRHKMDDIIQLSGSELDAAIDKFFDYYEKSQIKNNKRWWYPEVIRMKDMRNLDITRKK